MPLDLPDSTQLYGDLSSLPSFDRRLWNEDVFALDQLIQMDRSGPYASTFAEIIRDRMALLDVELSQRLLLTEVIQSQVHHQLRAASDLQRGGFVVEQWVPALRSWIVCGKFAEDTPSSVVVAQLRAGDPRFQTPAERFEETKAQAAANRKALDRASDEKVWQAVDDLSTKQLEDFVAVEGALKTGETITAHGPDAQYIENALANTKKAAAAGETHAQQVLTHGLRDTALCLNPGDNPNVR